MRTSGNYTQKFIATSPTTYRLIRMKKIRSTREISVIPDDGGSMTSETSVNFYQTTRRNNPEESILQTHHRKKPQILRIYEIFIILIQYLM
jgi:hypothetical protein